MAVQASTTRRTGTTSSRAIISFVLLAAAAILYAEEIATSAVPSQSVIWGSLSLGTYTGSLLCWLGASRYPGVGLARWKLGPWILLWYSFTFGLATVTWSRPQPSTAGEIAVEQCAACTMACRSGGDLLDYWLLGWAGRLSARCVRRGMEAIGRHRTGIVRSAFAPWIMYAIGMAARVGSAVTTGRFGYVGDAASAVSTATAYQQFLSELGYLCPLAVCAAALELHRQRLPIARISLAILFLSELVVGSLSGNKGNLIVAVLALVIPISAVRRRIPKIPVVAAALIFLVIVVPFNQAYRTAVRSGSTTLSTSQAIAASPAILQQAVKYQSMFAGLPTAVTYLLQREQEINGPSIIMQRTPAQIPFINPDQLVLGPLEDMIPRAIWPRKPILALGYQFSQQYYGLSATVYTSSAISPIGDLYRHGGWVPVIAGMFVFGCVVRLLDDVLDISTNFHAIFLVLLLFPILVTSESDWVTLIAGVPGIAMTWLLAITLGFRTRRAAGGD